MLIALVVIAVIVIAGVAYYTTMPAPGPTPTPTPTMTATAMGPETLVFSVVGAHWAMVKMGPDPALDTAVCGYIPLLYETLFEYDPVALQSGQYKIIPWLAQSYSASPDGLHWTFNLRKGVKFHTGNEMTADDVVYSYKRFYFGDWTAITNYLWAPQFISMPMNIATIEKTDDYTVTITLKARIPTFTEFLAQTQWSIVDSKAVQAHEKTLPEFGNAKDLGYTWLNNENNDAGTGTYVIKRIDQTIRYEFTLFDGWWGGPPELKLNKPVFKNIVYIPVNDDTDGRLKILKGDVQIISDFLAETVAALKTQPGIATSTTYAPDGMGLWMHCVNGPLKNWQVRKAIKMAINYTAMADVVNAGGSVVAQGHFLAGMVGWEKNARYFPDAQYAEANALLDKAGYPVKSDGFRFHINMYLRPAPRWGLDFTKIGLAIRADLANIKIDAVPVVLEVSEYYSHVYGPSEEMMWVQPFNTNLHTSPIELLSYWAAPNGGPFYFGYNRTTQPPEFIDKTDELFNKALAEPDDAARVPIMQELDAYVLEHGPYVTVADANYHVAFSAHLKGFFWGPKLLLPALFFTTWQA